MGKRVFLMFVIAALAIVLVGSRSVAIGQNDPVITIDLAEYDNNPVLPLGEPGDWDELIFFTTVIYHDGMFHMLYWGHVSGDPAAPMGTGYATSTDGLTWVKFEGNPVHVYADDQGRAGGACGMSVEDDYWVIYLCIAEQFGAPPILVMRATAPDPTTEWTIDPTPIMEAGGTLEWDNFSIMPHSLIKTSDEYVVYYASADGFGLGRITSSDGIIWTKYNDPDTTSNLYATSDPIMETGPGQEWDAGGVNFPLVHLRDEGWEMFYSGYRDQVSGMGYATSPDGINWTRFEDNPVVSILRIPSSFVVVDDVYYIYYFGVETWDVRVMTGTVTWE